MDQDQPSLGPVFLSASVPDPKRNLVYSKDVDVIAIREAVCALAEVVLPTRDLHFGGHPAISPLIVTIARSLDRVLPGRSSFDAVTVYQSEFFRKHIPQNTLAFSRLKWTPEVHGDRDKSLEVMRREMLDPNSGSPTYSAAFFIGGMEGIEDEFSLLRRFQPSAAFWPIASTKGAAGLVYARARAAVHSQPAAQKLGGQTHATELLERTLTYRQCFRELLSAS